MATLTITRETEDTYELNFLFGDILNVVKGISELTIEQKGDGRYPTTITLMGPPSAIEQVFRYFYRDADAVMSAAENIEYRKYRKMIEDAAQGIRDEIAAGDIEDEDALTERIESSGEVIYYAEAALTLRHSSNSDAYENEMGDGNTDECVRASFAQVADIREELGDVDDLLARLSPLSDDEKEQAEQYVKDEIASRLDEPYSDADMRDLINDACVDVRDTDEGQEKVRAYLHTLYPNL
jgi:hypothetical protein